MNELSASDILVLLKRNIEAGIKEKEETIKYAVNRQNYELAFYLDIKIRGQKDIIYMIIEMLDQIWLAQESINEDFGLQL